MCGVGVGVLYMEELGLAPCAGGLKRLLWDGYSAISVGEAWIRPPITPFLEALFSCFQG